MKKYFTLVIMLCVSTLALSVSAQDPTITLQLTLNGFSEDVLETAVAEYESLNPDIKVQLNPNQGFGSPVGYSDDATEYQDDLTTYFSTADVLLIDSELNSEATRAGYVLDLSPLIQSDPNFNFGDYHASMLNSFQWDGGQWAIPISGDFIVMTYHPEAFDAAGLAYPAEWWTIYDLDLAVRDLTQYDAEGVITMPGINLQGFNNNVTIRNLFVSMLGHGVVDETAFPAEPDFSDPLLAEYMDVWHTMIVDGLFEQPDDDDFEEDDIAIQIGNPQQNFGGFGGGGGNNEAMTTVATLLPGGYAGSSVSGYAISSGTQYPQEAYDLIMHLSNDPNVVNITAGTTPAKILLDTSTAEDDGPGFGFFGGSVVEEMEPLLDTALVQAIPIAQMRYAQGITQALDLMESDELDAQTALIDITAQIQDRVVIADDRAQTTSIIVQDPLPEIVLSEGEIVLNFAVLGGGGGGAAVALWEQLADEFVASDPEVGIVNIEQEFPLDLATVAENYQCFYSSTNQVANIDISTVLSLDPLIFADPNYDPNDYVGGVLEQVQLNSQTYALPLQIAPVVLRYNEDILNQVGVFAPTEMWTVSEFEDTLQQLLFGVEEGQAPMELNSSSQTSVLALIAVYGGIPFDTRTDPITIDFTSPETVNAIQQFLSLADEGKIEFSTGGGFGGGGGGQNAGVPLYSGILNAIPFGFGGGGGGGNNQAGIVTFPQGFDYNVAAFDIATAYISATAQYPEACYRFISFAAQATNIFDSMPARHSLINSPSLQQEQGEATVAFYQSMATLIEQSNTIVLPANIDFTSGAFGVTTWLFQVFESYLNDEVIDLEADLAQAQQTTQDYLTCVQAIPPIDVAAGIEPQDFFGEIQACQAAVNTE